jgi:hypothetical protein
LKYNGGARSPRFPEVRTEEKTPLAAKVIAVAVSTALLVVGSPR